MDTNVSPELNAFHVFVSKLLVGEGPKPTPEEAIAIWRAQRAEPLLSVIRSEVSAEDLVAFDEFAKRYPVDENDAPAVGELRESFAQYLSDLKRLQQKLGPSMVQADRGEHEPLDDTAFWQRVKSRGDCSEIPQ